MKKIIYKYQHHKDLEIMTLFYCINKMEADILNKVSRVDLEADISIISNILCVL